MFAMLWSGVYDIVFQFMPISNTAIEEESDNNPQATINSMINYVKEMCRAAWGKWWSHQILTGFLIHAPTFF